MNPMICKNCGGHINPQTYKCDYCDTQYKDDCNPNIIRVETYPFRTEELICGMTIPMEIVDRIDDSHIGSFVHQELAHKFAEKLVPYMEMRINEDPAYMRFNVKARVKVVMPELGR